MPWNSPEELRNMERSKRRSRGSIRNDGRNGSSEVEDNEMRITEMYAVLKASL
jgi:hypothetical protein